MKELDAKNFIAWISLPISAISMIKNTEYFSTDENSTCLQFAESLGKPKRKLFNLFRGLSNIIV